MSILHVRIATLQFSLLRDFSMRIMETASEPQQLRHGPSQLSLILHVRMRLARRLPRRWLLAKLRCRRLSCNYRFKYNKHAACEWRIVGERARVSEVLRKRTIQLAPTLTRDKGHVKCTQYMLPSGDAPKPITGTSIPVEPRDRRGSFVIVAGAPDLASTRFPREGACD